ncbi:MAG TPA: GatB/YqeY domain-containing protein [Actinomycetes bacterium]|jgi:uncharacterized protein YqeY|nr:GatB/YqeY domain-containing protein [Actinomycetes bacterium]
MEIRPPELGSLRERLRSALPRALKARDAVAVAALRSALAAIDNAEAVEGPPAPRQGAGHAPIAGTVAGLGAAEAERRSLTDVQVEAIVRAEVAERQAAARDYERAGRQEHAERLRAEAGVLSSLLA